jgi:Spy/CpxP family protein refolding chaperone
MKKLLVLTTILMFSTFPIAAFAGNNTGMMGQGYGYGMMGSSAGGQNSPASSQNNQAPGYGNYGRGYGYGMMGPGYGYGMMGYGMMGPGYGYGMMGPGYGYGMMGYGMMGPGYGYGMMGPGYGFGMMGRGYGYGATCPGYGYGMWGRGYGHGDGYPGNLSRADQEKIETAREEFFKDTQALRDKMYKTQSALYAELAQKEPNAKKAANLQKELSSLQAQFAQKRIVFQLKMRKLLPQWGGANGYRPENNGSNQ